jgi:NTE family protein
MKIGLVLSGGGIRGIAHLGVLSALSKAGVPINHISGTSAGAIVGALFAAGLEPEKAFRIFMDMKLITYIRPSFGALGLINIEKTGAIFKKYLPAHIEDLPIRLTVCATNFNEGTITYFEKGPLIRAIHASSCIPGFFQPIVVHKQLYIDGGVLNNFPVEPLLTNCDYIIGSTCNHLRPNAHIKSITSVVKRAATMSINHDMESKAKHCNLLIEPIGLGEINTFDTKKTETIFWLGYEAALKEIEKNESFRSIVKSGS